jgi:hypothetical protein
MLPLYVIGVVTALLCEKGDKFPNLSESDKLLKTLQNELLEQRAQASEWSAASGCFGTSTGLPRMPFLPLCD